MRTSIRLSVTTIISIVVITIVIIIMLSLLPSFLDAEPLPVACGLKPFPKCDKSRLLAWSLNLLSLNVLHEEFDLVIQSLGELLCAFECNTSARL